MSTPAPANPYGFKTQEQVRAYMADHGLGLPAGGHAGAADDLEAAALADEAREDAREWAAFLAGRR